MCCRVHSCLCGCGSLRTGSLIIAILDLLSNATVFIISVILLKQISEWGDVDKLYTFFRAVAIVYAILLANDIFLLIGIAQDKAYLICPWLFFANIIVALTFIATVIIGIGYMEVVSGGFLETFYACCYLVVRVYFLMVVRSHYSSLKEIEKGSHLTANPNLPQPFPNGQQVYPNVIFVQQPGNPNRQQP